MVSDSIYYNNNTYEFFIFQSQNRVSISNFLMEIVYQIANAEVSK